MKKRGTLSPKRRRGWIVACGWLLIAGSARAEIQGRWTDGDPKSTLVNVHLLGAATLLKDGRVIAAGGLDRKSLAIAADTVAELYDPVERRWKLAAPLNSRRWSLDAVTLRNGKALFAGGSSGFTPTGALATAELFDPETRRFIPTGNDLSVARQSFGITELADGTILIAGGNGAGNNLGGSGVTAVDIFDPATNTFRVAASLNFGRALHAQLTLRDGRVVVIGGAQTNAEVYDPVKNVWTVSAGNLPTTLKDMKGFELFDGRIWIPGGQNTVDGLTTDNSWFFDVAAGQFTPGPSLKGFNYAPAGVQIGCSDYSAFDLFPPGHKLRGRYIFVAGGEHDPPEGADVELNSAMIFDARREKLIDVGPMPFIHDDHTESLLRINDKGNPEVLLFGGNSTPRTSRFELDVKSLPEP